MDHRWRELRTCDTAGQAHTFFYVSEPSEFEEGRFDVVVTRRIPQEENDDVFSFEFRKIDNTDMWRIESITRNGQNWAYRKGIIREVLKRTSKVLDGIIVSSISGTETNFRTTCAEDMWIGLRDAGCASYDEARRRWIYRSE